MAGHLTDLDEDNSNLGDSEEPWTEPLNPATNGTLICSDFIHKPAVSKIGHSRTIIHFDIDCFYAQVEMLRNPELRNKPVGIQQKNIVVTTNYIARQCGVPKSSYVSEAKKICSDLVLVCGEDLTNYRQMSYRISEFLQKYTSCVERLGFDENFIDASELVQKRLQDGTFKEEFVGHVYHGKYQGINRSHCRCGCELRLQIGSQIAADIREALHKVLGITSCAGIGHNKLLAKVVAGTHKPSQQTTVLPHLALDLLSSFSSVLCIPGIGYRTSQRLNAIGVSSVIDLQAADRKVLVKEFGPQMAQLMNQLSCGVDDSPVVAYSQPQTLSDEDAFKCCKELAEVEQRIKDLTRCLLKRVAEDGRIPHTVRLTVRRVPNKYHRETRQCPVPVNIFTKFLQLSVSEDVVERLMPILMNLFIKLVDTSKPFHLTLIGVCFAKLKPIDEPGSIGTFFTKAETLSQSGESNSVTNKPMNNQSEGKCLFNSKSSSVEREFKTKPEAKVKTLKYFFPTANTEAHSVSLETCNTAGWKASQQSLSHRSDLSLAVTDATLLSTDVTLEVSDATLGVTDVAMASKQSLALTDAPITMMSPIITDVPMSDKQPATIDVSLITIPRTIIDELPLLTQVPLTGTDACQRSLIVGCAERQTTNGNVIPSQPEPIHYTDFLKTQQMLQDLATTTSHSEYTEETSAAPSGNNSDKEVNSLEEDCLEKLLSAGIDVKTITELPIDIQNEVLLQYGIFVEDLPQGRRFMHIYDKVRTRSNRTPKLTTLETRHLHGAKSKSNSKRNLECSLLDIEVLDRNSKQRKVSCADNEMTNNKSSWKVTETENGDLSRCAEALNERSVATESLSCVVIEEQQQNIKITTTGNSTAVNEEKPRTNINTFSCSRVFQLPDKDSYCVSISHLLGKDSDGANISQLPGCELANGLPGQHTNKAVPNGNLDTCTMGLRLQCNPKLTSYSSAERDEPASLTLPEYIPSQPRSSTTPLSDHIPSQPRSSTTPLSDHIPSQPRSSTTPLPDHIPSQPRSSTTPLPDHIPSQPCSSTTPLPDHIPSQPRSSTTPLPDHIPSQPCSSTTPLPDHIPSQPRSSTTPFSDHIPSQPRSSTTPFSDHIPSQPHSSTTPLPNMRKAACGKLPDSIDSEVFSSLPSNIRGEIMAHVAMGTLDSSGGQHLNLVAPDYNRNMKQIKNIKTKNQNSLLTYFKRDNTDPK